MSQSLGLSGGADTIPLCKIKHDNLPAVATHWKIRGQLKVL